MKASEFLAAALACAGRGWRVFPCAPQAKRPLTRHGFGDATTAEEQITAWWAKWPTANVAIATGQRSGLVVVDMDPRHDGMHSIEVLEDTLGELLPETPVVITGGGGTHTYLAHPDDDAPVPSSNSILPGIDVKADGGYVVAPPSIHPDGGVYAWNRWLPAEMEPAPVPPALLLWIRKLKEEPATQARQPTRRRHASALSVWEAVQRFPKVGARFGRDPSGLDDTSPSGIDYSLACMMAHRGFDADEIGLVIEESRRRAGLPRKRPTYYAATIAKALRLRGAA